MNLGTPQISFEQNQPFQLTHRLEVGNLQCERERQCCIDGSAGPATVSFGGGAETHAWQRSFRLYDLVLLGDEVENPSGLGQQDRAWSFWSLSHS